MKWRISYAFCMAFFIVISSVQSATITWDGGGADTTWSTPQNWAGDVVPSSDDDVVFDVTGSQDCVLDTDVTVLSLTVAPEYTHTISLQGHIVTCTGGDWNANNGAVIYSGATVCFTGADDQAFRVPNYTHTGVVLNQKAGGVLRLQYNSIFMERFQAQPGTVTAFPRGLLRVTDVILDGTDESPVMICSASVGQFASWELSGTQHIQHAHFTDIDASYGVPVDASDGCLEEPGTNRNILFSGVTFWDGGGSNTEWTTPENWSTDLVPGAGDAVVFDSRTAASCTLSAPVQVASFARAATYAGTMDFGSSVVNVVSGDVVICGNALVLSDAEFSFTSATDQSMRMPNYSQLGIIRNAKQGGTLRMAHNSISIETLICQAGTETRTPRGLLQIGALTLAGTTSSPVVIGCTEPGSQTTWAVRGSQNIQYATISDINASGGAPLDASRDCVDAGNNTNVLFRTVAYWIGGDDARWSVADNWSTGQVPNTQDIVIFDGHASTDCTLDQDVEVYALSCVANGNYRLLAGAQAVRICGGDVTLADGCALLEHATLIFTGTTDQHLWVPNYMVLGAFVNAQTSGSVEIHCNSATITAFSAQAGTVTRSPHGLLNVTTLSFTGTAALPVTMLSPSDGVVASWAVHGAQSIQYTHFKDIDASRGVPVDASRSCALDGNTVNILLTPLCRWIGGGVDNSWTTPENWSGGRVPAENDTVLFDGTTAQICVIPQDVSFGSLYIAESYEGEVRGGTNTLSCMFGDVVFLSSHFAFRNSTLRFAGNGPQVCVVPNYSHIRGMTNEKLNGASLTLRYNSAQWDILTLAAGSQTFIPHGSTTIETLHADGVPGNMVTLASADVAHTAAFKLTGEQSVAYAAFTRIDASGGDTIVAIRGCTGEDEGNVNFLFSLEGNTAPVMQPIWLMCTVNGQITTKLDATDAEGHPITFELTTPPLHGTAEVAGSALTFVPETDWNGVSTMTVTPCDGFAYGAAVTVTVIVCDRSSVFFSGHDIVVAASQGQSPVIPYNIDATSDISGDPALLMLPMGRSNFFTQQNISLLIQPTWHIATAGLDVGTYHETFLLKMDGSDTVCDAMQVTLVITEPGVAPEGGELWMAQAAAEELKGTPYTDASALEQDARNRLQDTFHFPDMSYSILDQTIIHQEVQKALDSMGEPTPEGPDRDALQKEFDELLDRAFGGHPFADVYTYKMLNQLSEAHWNAQKTDGAIELAKTSVLFLSDLETYAFFPLHRAAQFLIWREGDTPQRETLRKALDASRSCMLSYFSYIQHPSALIESYLHDSIGRNLYNSFPVILPYSDYDVARHAQALYHAETALAVCDNPKRLGPMYLRNAILAWAFGRMKITVQDAMGKHYASTVTLTNVSPDTVIGKHPFTDIRSFSLNGKSITIPVYTGHTYDVVVTVTEPGVTPRDIACAGFIPTPGKRFECVEGVNAPIESFLSGIDAPSELIFTIKGLDAETPVALNQAITMAEDSDVNITLSAIDPNGDALTFTVLEKPAHGVLQGTAPQLRYIPDENYCQEDALTFTASDGTHTSPLAKVNFRITPVNDAPVPRNAVIFVPRGQRTSVDLTAFDVEDDVLGYVVTQRPEHGVLAGDAPKVTYTSDADFSGEDTLTYVVSDGEAERVGRISLRVFDVTSVVAVAPDGGNGDVQTVATIQQAVDEATGPTLILVQPGVHAAGQEGITLQGRIILCAKNPEGETVIDCSGMGRGVSIAPGAVVELRGLTIRHAMTENDGAGLVATDATLVMHDCVFENGTADHGGGAAFLGTTSATCIGCHFVGNTALSGGGGAFVANNAKVVFQMCTFEKNKAPEGAGCLTESAP